MSRACDTEFLRQGSFHVSMSLKNKKSKTDEIGYNCRNASREDVLFSPVPFTVGRFLKFVNGRFVDEEERSRLLVAAQVVDDASVKTLAVQPAIVGWRIRRLLIIASRRVEQSAQENAPEGASVQFFDVRQQLAYVAVQRLNETISRLSINCSDWRLGCGHLSSHRQHQLTTFSHDFSNFNEAVSRVINGLKMQLMTWPSVVRGALKCCAKLAPCCWS